MDHAYSKISQKTGLKVHSAPLGSLSTVKQINQRNHKRSHKHVEPESHSVEDTHKDKKDKKEKKDKKDKKKKDDK